MLNQQNHSSSQVKMDPHHSMKTFLICKDLCRLSLQISSCLSFRIYYVTRVCPILLEKMNVANLHDNTGLLQRVRRYSTLLNAAITLPAHRLVFFVLPQLVSMPRLA